MADAEFERRVAEVRRFARFYTQKIGVLEEHLLKSRFSLTEARVIYELANRDAPTAAELARDLGIDPGYLSRILRSFARRGLLRKERSAADARQQHLRITDRGRKAFAPLNRRSQDEVAAMLRPLSVAEQAGLVEAMRRIETLLGAKPEAKAPYVLRPHQPGDIGWIIGRHATLYAQEYGWDGSFEGMVAEIGARFIAEFDPARERCWIAEKDGEPVGSVVLVRKSARVAKLRLLIVDPKARGLGIGRRLVEECIRFARQAGYARIVLWTNSILTAARAIYVATGFQLVHAEPHRSFGQDLIGETWELKL